ncbi:MAG: hypothetical protein HYU59_10930 [Magnetospirillum gryphiswaldense]|nr:hypothetical protein [Magnetospirillum gryphiswaldense]
MTTNHPDRLDPVLIRPGRVDHNVERSASLAELQHWLEIDSTSTGCKMAIGPLKKGTGSVRM